PLVLAPDTAQVIVNNPVSCRPNVQDQDTGPRIQPLGTLTWSLGSGPAAYSFSPSNTCTLDPATDPNAPECPASSRVIFTPNVLGTFAVNIDYAPDRVSDPYHSPYGLANGARHFNATGSNTFTVIQQLGCSPPRPSVSGSGGPQYTDCTVEVTNTS